MKGLRMGNKLFAFSLRTYEKSFINQCVDIIPHQMKGTKSRNKNICPSHSKHMKKH
jgi:hypothetical protein